MNLDIFVFDALNHLSFNDSDECYNNSYTQTKRVIIVLARGPVSGLNNNLLYKRSCTELLV